MNKLKILTVLGTRPEIIRLSCVVKLLEQYTTHILVHTGQNHDHALNQIFFDEFGLRQPDYYLDVDTSTLGKTLGEVLIKTEEVLMREKPDAMLVLGDTNSAIAALIAKRMKIPIYHMEAGNRSFDANVPEEINRRLVDHLADFNLVYTEHARRHLLSEGLPHRHIYLTGSPLFEVLQSRRQQIDDSTILRQLSLQKKRYFIVSLHREENVDSRENMRKVLDCLAALHDHYQYPVIVSTHPRTRNRLQAMEWEPQNRDIRFLPPFGYGDYNKLQLESFCAVSDSGTISEESAMLGFPAVTLRQSMERPEALDCGSIALSGLEANYLLQLVDMTVREHEQGHAKNIPAEYKIENTASRVVKLILGTAKLSNRWHNRGEFSRYDW